MVVNGKVSNPQPAYSSTLQISKTAVCRKIPIPNYNGQFSKTLVTNIMAYICKQLAVNLKVHTTRHALHCLNNWLTNKIRADLDDEDYDASPKQLRRNIGKVRKNLANLKPDLNTQYKNLKAQLDAIFNDESKDGKNLRTSRLVCRI
jgi:hypothetical protein